MKRRIVSFALLLVVAVSLLCSCGKKAGYKNNVEVGKLAESAEKAAKLEGLSEIDDNYINNRMQLELTDVSEYVVKVNVYGTNIDEYGIFKAENEKQAKALSAELEDYLKRRDDEWMHEYMPEEYPKLEKAECKSYGNYVVYAILSDDAKSALFADVKSQLKQ